MRLKAQSHDVTLTTAVKTKTKIQRNSTLNYTFSHLVNKFYLEMNCPDAVPCFLVSCFTSHLSCTNSDSRDWEKRDEGKSLSASDRQTNKSDFIQLNSHFSSTLISTDHFKCHRLARLTVAESTSHGDWQCQSVDKSASHPARRPPFLFQPRASVDYSKSEGLRRREEKSQTVLGEQSNNTATVPQARPCTRTHRHTHTYVDRVWVAERARVGT